MNQQQIIKELSRNKEIFRALLSKTDDEQIRWKPAAEKWCLIEALCHLYDEEREDFRARVKHCLENPERQLPAIDPVGWVSIRDYINQNFYEKLQGFLKEREYSIKWLESLENPAWENAHDHPRFGKMSANLFLSNWLAHDFIHIRQINRLRYEFHESHSSDKLFYAGNW